MNPMTDAELNELTHTVADMIEAFTHVLVDRMELNTRLTALVQDFGVELVP